MKKLQLFQVDAFTDTLFSGNPAAVCVILDELSENTMQSIAAENNLAETAFIRSIGDDYEIRWFTPTVEVDLCGHATLAAAYVLFNCLAYSHNEIAFHSMKSGILKVSRQQDWLFLDFPTDTLKQVEWIDEIGACIGIAPKEVYKGRTDYLAVLQSEQEVKTLKPDISLIARLYARGLIVTAKGDRVDFVSRFFAPQVGVDEDPVTGSAHTSLIPLWHKKLGKTQMSAKQLSKRGGTLNCMYQGNRCLIGGQSKLYLTGHILID
jgi:PhzF family phenazine biosynthesis protein